jgi:hypothetical protein
MTCLAKLLAIPLLVENRPRMGIRRFGSDQSRDREAQGEREGWGERDSVCVCVCVCVCVQVEAGGSGPEVASHASTEGLICTKSTAVDN